MSSFRRSLLSLLPTKRERAPSTALDLCFAAGGEQEELRNLWQQLPAQPDKVGFDSLCGALWLCAERPAALSITHAGAEQPILPTIIAYIHHANEILSSTTDNAEGSSSAGTQSQAPLWRECGAGVALIHAAARLFVELSATPQYRFLLLQHDLPAHVRLAISRLADCLQVLSGVHATEWYTQRPPRHVFGGGADSTAAGSADDARVAEEQVLAVLNALQLCTQLLGCLWQAGFSALHAREHLRGPTLPRLPDSVEGLLRVPNATLGVGLDASAAGGVGGSSGVDASSSSASATHGVLLRAGEHAQQLLRLLRLSHAQREEHTLGSMCWSTAVRLQRLAAAALGVLLAAHPESETAVLHQRGVSVLLLCMHPHAHEAGERVGRRSGELSTSTQSDARAHRQLLQLQLQCLLVAFAGGAPSEASEWRSHWNDAGGAFLLSRMIRSASATFDESGADGGAAAPSERSSATSGGAVSAASSSDEMSASDRVIRHAAEEAGSWSGGMSSELLAEWWLGVTPPAISETARRADALPNMERALIEVVSAAESVVDARLPELSIVFSFLRAVCESYAAPNGGSESNAPDGGNMVAEVASETQETVMRALLEAFMPTPSELMLGEETHVAADFGGEDTGASGLDVDQGLGAQSADTPGWQLKLLGMLCSFGASVVFRSPLLAPRALRLLCSAHFVPCAGNEAHATWPDGVPTPLPLSAPSYELDDGGEVRPLESDHEAITLAPISMLAVHHARALLTSPRLHGDAAAECASVVLVAIDTHLDAMRGMHTQQLTTDVMPADTFARQQNASDADQSLHASRALWLCFCDLMAALHARAPPQAPLPMEPAGLLPTEWNRALEHLAVLLAAHCRHPASRRPTGTTSRAPAQPIERSAMLVGLRATVCNACAMALALPQLARWALQQMDGSSSLFAALIGMVCEAGAETGQMARFALRQVVVLLRHAALECRLEGELQGLLVTSDSISSYMPAWAIGVRLFSSFAGLLAPSLDQPRELRGLLLDSIERLVHSEAAALQQGASTLIHPQQAIGESFSQRLLRECGIWTHILAALDAEAELSAPSFVEMLLHVLDMLPVLTWGGAHAQSAFMSAIGHEKMLQLLLRAGAPTDVSVVARLFNWFAGAAAQVDHCSAAAVPLGTRLDAEAFAWSVPGASIVQMADVAQLLLVLLPHMEEPLQLDLLQRLGTLLEASILNRSRCSALRLLRQMLQLLSTPLSDATQRALLRALTPLASHSVSVSELKLLFGLLAQQPSEDGAGMLHNELLATIASMLRQHGPAASFIFDGHHSGLILPPLARLPPGGYTFCAWLYVDTFLPPASAASSSASSPTASGELSDELPAVWSPRLLSLRDEQGRGIEIIFVRERLTGRVAKPNASACLHLRTLGSSPAGAASVAAGSSFAAVHALEFKHTFKTGRWYHIGIAHEASRLFAKSHATLYVDGKAQDSGSIKFPTSERLTCCFLGTNYATPLSAASGQRGLMDDAMLLRERPQALCGQVGAAFLFAEALDADRLQHLWSLGASFDWAPLDRGESSSTMSSGFESGPSEQAAMAPLLLALNPKSRDGDHFPNNIALASPETSVNPLASTSRAPAPQAQNAVLAVGSHACVTHTVRDSAHCLGGVQLLFPLLARRPVAGERAEQLLVQVLGLMSQMLFDSAPDRALLLSPTKRDRPVLHCCAVMMMLTRSLLSRIAWSRALYAASAWLRDLRLPPSPAAAGGVDRAGRHFVRAAHLVLRLDRDTPSRGCVAALRRASTVDLHLARSATRGLRCAEGSHRAKAARLPLANVFD